MVSLIGRGWRSHLSELIGNAQESLLIAAPYIKRNEANWVRELLPSGVSITTLAHVQVDAVGSAALDIDALRLLADATSESSVYALPALHAKVYVADEVTAIVTSGNLTRAGLDTNLEYGAILRAPELVQKVRSDMRSLSQLGSPISADVFDSLLPLEESIREARANVIDSATEVARARFDAILKEARPALASIQVGTRTANSVFSEAITYVLADRVPRPTTTIASAVKQLLPDLCDDYEELLINGQRFGKAWKHRVRNAQQYLKNAGRISYEKSTREWRLSLPDVTG